MAIRRFEDIIAWQKAQDLAVEIYRLFQHNRDVSFRNQICSAAVSVSSNIAEGFMRSSHADFARFLYIASGSCSEIKSLLYLAERLCYIKGTEKELLVSKTDEISRLVYGLIRSLKKHA